MNVNEKNVAVVFEDAAEYENAARRERLLPEKNGPYTVLIDNSLGVPDGAVMAPEPVRDLLLSKSAESCSTWMRIQADDWECIKATGRAQDFDDIFKTSFTIRLQHLHYVLEALGCRKTTLESSERKTSSTHKSVDIDTKVSGAHPTVDFKASEKASEEVENKYHAIVKQTLCQEFEQHDEVDVEQAWKIMQKYGFENDHVLRGILDAAKLGRKGPPKVLNYTFSGEFIGDISKRVTSALKVSAGLKKVSLGVDMDNDIELSRKKHEEIIQTLSIKIEN